VVISQEWENVPSEQKIIKEFKMTKREKFGQILMPLITPYKENEEVNYEAYAQLIEYSIKNDVCDTLIVTGTTGEASLLTFDERTKLMEVALKASNGRKPVVAGTGCTSTKETIALTKKAEELGIDTCMIVCPYFNKPNQEGIYRHYKAIAESTKCDIILYNIPIFVGVNIDPATVGRLVECKNIIGIKDESGINPTQITDYFIATEKKNPDFIIYNGDDQMLLPTIIQGAMGIVSGGAHILGKQIRGIFNSYNAGDMKTASSLFRVLYSVSKSFGQNGRILPNPIMRPVIEYVTGITLGPVRAPLAPATEQELETAKAVLKEYGIVK
jgi:4-hydroxy-tetrahydrodipicolinate synthase